jgi:hypothetical protein
MIAFVLLFWFSYLLLFSLWQRNGDIPHETGRVFQVHGWDKLWNNNNNNNNNKNYFKAA